MSIIKALSDFTSLPLFEASRNLFAELGVHCTEQSALPLNFLSIYEKSVKKLGLAVPQALADVFAKIETTHVIGAVTEDSLAGKIAATSLEEIEAAEAHYKGMLLMSVKVKDGVTLTRTEMTQITRGANRIATHNPVTVLILEKAHTEARRHGDGVSDLRASVSPCETLLSIATCERTTFQQTWRPGEKLGKVSILKDINCENPHRGHIDILKSMDVSACKTYDELYAQWKDVFSAKLLTKQFYREIQNWYFWALKKEQHVAFPNALDDDSDDAKYNAENVIRLITRLIFTWFMKEKGLVNPDLFDPAFLKKALKHFAPSVGRDDSIAPEDCTYYRAILQNLFFATFNQEVGLRGFVETQVRDAKRYNIKNYYRNDKLFTETDKAKIIAYFNGSPFVNGGLFECLDNVEQADQETGKTRTYSWDGFSNSVRSKSGSLKSALIPDRLFFGDETTADLSEFFEKDKSARHVKVRGLVNILNDYVFTIEENTPFDEDVALDPELLGKVFENLLGCYNPETQQMARNATGSFYTPREIVNYMVKVSLQSYLKRACPQVAPAEVDALVEGVAGLDEMPSVKEHAREILTALFKAKILDPACGSGAFPMGVMSAMVEILRTVDPDNRHWYEIVLKESLGEAETVADVGDERERAVLKEQIEHDFKSRVDHPDYARKLYVIEHCIFGSDIQPIAVQISRLRFFITLLCEQSRTDDPAKNYGITPLPNLENNFVAANSLLSIDLKDMRELLGQKKIVSLVKQLRAKRHQLFQPKTSDKKKRLQKEDEKLRGDIAAAAEGLYDENVAQRIQLLEAEIKHVDAELKKLTADDFKDVVREVEETDLFGNVTVTQKKVVGKGNELKKRRDAMADEVAGLKNASRKDRLLADLKRLVAWNPFAFNVAETFLDPEWMFGVKSGFDIVIGNPPYIQLQANGGELAKIYEGKGFETFAKTGDIYCLFYERASQVLRQNGVLCYITSNKWMRAGYGEGLRKFLAERTDPRLLIDFAGQKIFESATVDTNILVAERGAANRGETLACIATDACRESLGDFVRQAGLPCAFGVSDSWVILNPVEQSIKRKMEKIGKPLKEWDVQIYRGVLTGCNEAFIIDEATRGKILSACRDAAERKRTEQLIRPILRGQDIRRYAYDWADLYLIAAHNGHGKTPRIKIEDYPAVKRWLDEGGVAYNGKPFRGYKQIKDRSDQGDTPYNLRNCAYMDDFAKPQIVWIELSDTPKFALARNIVSANTVFFMTGQNLQHILGCLNSRLSTWYFQHCKGTTSGVGTNRWLKYTIEQLPIPPLSEELKVLVEMHSQNPQPDTDMKIERQVSKLFCITQEEMDYVASHV